MNNTTKGAFSVSTDDKGRYNVLRFDRVNEDGSKIYDDVATCSDELDADDIVRLGNLNQKFDLTKLEELVKAAEETSARGNGFLDLDNAIKSIKR